MAQKAKAKKAGSVMLKNKNHELFCHLYSGNKFGKIFGNATLAYMTAFSFDERVEKNTERLILMSEEATALWKLGEKEEHAQLKKQIHELEEENRSMRRTAASNGERLLRKADVLERIDYLFDTYLSPEAMDREMAFVIMQRKDLVSKVMAYDKVAKVRGRIAGKLDGEFVMRWETDEEKPSKGKDKKTKASAEPAKKLVASGKVRFMDEEED